MTRLSSLLRALWALYAALATAALVLTLGPTIESIVDPVRTDQRIVDVERLPPQGGTGLARFVWVSDKRRMAPFKSIDVALTVARARYVVTLFRDEAFDETRGDLDPSALPCARRIPWAHTSSVGVGPHRQRFCVELPETAGPLDPVSLRVTIRYHGLFGLWSVPVVMPPIDE